MRISGETTILAAPPAGGHLKLLEPRSALVIGASSNKIDIMGASFSGISSKERRRASKERTISSIPTRRDRRPPGVQVDRRAPGKGGYPPSSRFPPTKAAALLAELVREQQQGVDHLDLGRVAEESERGRELDRRLRESISGRRGAARAEGCRDRRQNCIGIVSKPGGYNTFFLPEYKLPFRGTFGERCAIVSQSGRYLVTASSATLDGRSIRNTLITFGNQADARRDRLPSRAQRSRSRYRSFRALFRRGAQP